SLRDELAERRADRGYRHFPRLHGTAGIVNELLTEAVRPAAVVADRNESAGCRVDGRLEELVAHASFVRQPHARGWRRRSRQRGSGHPRKAQAGHLDHEPAGAIAKLARFDRASDMDRPVQVEQLQSGAPREATRIEQEVARIIRGRSTSQSLSKRLRGAL